MGEVVMSVELLEGDGSAFAEVLRRRRWAPIAGVEGVWSCSFEHGFMDEVSRIVRDDLGGAAAETRWRVAYLHSAEGAQRVSASADPAASVLTPLAPWTDDGHTRGPIADVMLAVEGVSGAEAQALLASLGWRAAPGAASFLHAYDLAMFEPLADRVARDMGALAASLGRASLHGAWASATHPVSLDEGPPSPRVIRPMPWDAG